MPSFEYKRLNILDNLELFSSENENNYFPFHYHDYYCISLITKGTEILNNQEQEFIAPAGTISVTQLNEVHRNYSLAEPGYSYNTLYLSKELLEYYSDGKEVAALERVINDPLLFNSLRQLFDTKQHQATQLENSIRSLAGYSVNPGQSNRWLGIFGQIDDIIESHPNKPIDTEWLARMFRMSKFHFIREFKKAKGVTPQTYIMIYRLGKTKQMLINEVPLAEVAYLNGFYDQSHFTNSFKKYFGVTPGGYLG
ncbi:AraC family transcriptional regulator [Mucilaginibacter ginsenosidivorax]|uniref:AraC family transcriptional regulator n=1 Tax=Mucilaginibacter ginsenosidivorax TaxID=862126 RepID=A0A5B8W1C5_9SPHI|nr:AraC family transcriptional regulator [Mucilaginibacter ginsenosidivorax]QEC77780.1 AraC family transcriptional regulator [Mucilaginibacter ginsenosidivorax]